jgi:hypothetical protein
MIVPSMCFAAGFKILIIKNKKLILKSYEPGVPRKKSQQQTCNNNKFITEKLIKKIKITNYVHKYLKSK